MPAHLGFKETKIKTYGYLLTSLRLDKMSKIFVNEFLELNWLNVHDRYLQFFVVIFSSFTIISVLTTSVKFSVLLTIATHCCNKKLKLPFCKTKLGMQGLSYVGPSTWKKLPINLKIATSVNCFKYNIKKYFLKKLSETEANIYSYT